MYLSAFFVSKMCQNVGCYIYMCNSQASVITNWRHFHFSSKWQLYYFHCYVQNGLCQIKIRAIHTQWMKLHINFVQRLYTKLSPSSYVHGCIQHVCFHAYYCKRGAPYKSLHNSWSTLKALIHFQTQSYDPISCNGKPREQTSEIMHHAISLVHFTGFP